MPDLDLPLVDAVMSTPAFTLDADQDLVEAYQVLAKKPFSGVPVVKDGVVVGMLSETDALRAMASALFNGVPVGSVASAMRTPVVSVEKGMDLFTVADTLRANGIRRAPVMDGAKLLGVVTVKDCDKALLKVLEALSVVKRPPHTPGAAWE